MNFNDVFPVLSNNCNLIFKSLKYLKFNFEICFEVDINNVKNLYNNLDKIPNLKYFQLRCFSKLN